MGILVILHFIDAHQHFKNLWIRPWKKTLKPEKDGTEKAEIKLIPVPNVTAIHLLNITGDFLTVGLR